ncbi:hypothetical protein DFH06DRAFT_1338728 [Mycena polygramma]|nr:hypothetical protein DFH06DRAFT_1338728 [Mycena polygramma]
MTADANYDGFDHDLVLPHLRRLYIQPGSFLDNLTAPILDYLACDTVASVLPFLQRSQCQLTTLVLTESTQLVLSKSYPDESFALSAENLISLLRNIPSLRNLFLQFNRRNAKNNNQVLKGMTMTGSGDDVCPNLVHLAFGFSQWTWNAQQSDLFAAMIRSRFHPTQPRSLLSLSYCSKFGGTPKAEDQMRILRNEGLDVRLIDPWGPFLRDAYAAFVFAR